MTPLRKVQFYLFNLLPDAKKTPLKHHSSFNYSTKSSIEIKNVNQNKFEIFFANDHEDPNSPQLSTSQNITQQDYHHQDQIQDLGNEGSDDQAQRRPSDDKTTLISPMNKLSLKKAAPNSSRGVRRKASQGQQLIQKLGTASQDTESPFKQEDQIPQQQQENEQNCISHESQNSKNLSLTLKKSQSEMADSIPIDTIKTPKNRYSHADPNQGFNNGRWSPDEHFRFLEALKIYGKEWRKVQQHVSSRTSTQARSHAQKFFVKLDKNNISLEDFLCDLDIDKLQTIMQTDGLKDEDAIDELLLTNNKNPETVKPIANILSPMKKRRKSNIMNMAMKFQSPQIRPVGFPGGLEGAYDSQIAGLEEIAMRSMSKTPLVQRHRSEDLTGLMEKKKKGEVKLDFLESFAEVSSVGSLGMVPNQSNGGSSVLDEKPFLPPITESVFDKDDFLHKTPSNEAPLPPTNTYITNQTYVQQNNNSNTYNININGYIVVVPPNSSNPHTTTQPTSFFTKHSRGNSLDDNGFGLPPPPLFPPEDEPVNTNPFDWHTSTKQFPTSGLEMQEMNFQNLLDLTSTEFTK